MAVISVALLAVIVISEATMTPPGVEPVDTGTWLAAEAGDTVIVTGTAGQELSGDVVGLTSDTLFLMAAGVRLDVDRRDVRQVRRRFADPVGDGTIQGLAAGAGSGVLLSFLASRDLVISDLTEAGQLAFVTGILSLAGMAIGRVLDGMVRQEQVIYRAPGVRPTTTFGPLLSKDVIGAGVTVEW